MTFAQKLSAAVAAIALSTTALAGCALAGEPASAEAGFHPDKARTAVLITDPQNDFMSEDGAAWGLVKDNVLRLKTREHIGTLITSAKAAGMDVFVSPHAYFETDDAWKSRGPIQQALHDIGAFSAHGTTSYEGIDGSGADFYGPLKAKILDGKTVVTSPHKIYGPESNDLALQLRKHGIDTVILGGYAANLCTDSHMRELKEEGFNVIVVNDAIGAPGEDAYNAAILNASMIADAVWSTDQAAAFIK